MKNWVRWLLFLLLQTYLLSAGYPARQAQAAIQTQVVRKSGWPQHRNQQKVPPYFEPGDCPFRQLAGVQVECGFLTVLEDRSRPQGRILRLAVAILKSKSQSPAPDPLVFLQGGPGMGALGIIPAGGAAQFAPFLARRDVIFFDQRGTGLSQPALNCPDVQNDVNQSLGQEISFTEALSHTAILLTACRQHWVETGVDLNAYTSAASAADIADLRRALGYTQINLYGASYGTRLALTVLRDQPEGIRSAILDSTFPPQVSSYQDGLKNMYHALETLFAGCAADRICRLAYPDLKEVFYALADRLDDEPASIASFNPYTRQPVQIKLSGSMLAGTVRNQLYNTAALPRLPGIIYDAYDGNYEALVELYWKSAGLGKAIDLGMALSILCHEEVPFAEPLQIAAEAQNYPAALRRLNDQSAVSGAAGPALCLIWQVDPAGTIENQPVTSPIPTLILAGEYDPVTPPSYGRWAAETLSNSYFYELPGVGHGVIAGGACPTGLMLTFLNSPQKAPDPACIAEMLAPRFVLRARLARPWAGLASLLLLGLVIWNMRKQGLQRGWTAAWRGSLKLVTPSLWLASAATLILGILLNTAGEVSKGLAPLQAARLIETIVPLFVAMQAAYIFSPEDEGPVEALLACSRPTTWIVLERLALIFAGQALVAAAGLGAIAFLSQPELPLHSVETISLAALSSWIAPALFLGGVGLCLTLITRRAVLGMTMTILLWWSMSFMGRIMVERWPVLWPLNVYLQSVEVSGPEYLLNRLFIFLVGAWLITLALHQLQDEERLLTGVSTARQPNPERLTA